MESRHQVRLMGCSLFAAVAAVYANSLLGPLVFDDVSTVTENPTVRRGWALWQALRTPPGGLTVSGRPIANLSIALNHSISGEATWSYHVFNLLIHAGAALVLFGIVRRTLHRDWPAWAVALVWAVHPLQTESVTYIVQRTESLEGLFLLLTLYLFILSSTSPSSPTSSDGLVAFASSERPERRAKPEAERAPQLRAFRGPSADNERKPRRLPLPIHRMRLDRWFGAWSIFCCLAGMATKESMAVAPVIVLLYDRTFLAGSFSGALRARWRYYLALAATWIPLALLVAANGGNRGGTVGPGAGISLWDYWLTQFPAIVHYLRLAFWPAPLAFEYGKFWVSGIGAVWWQATVVIGLLAATAVALVRWPRVGFLGATFFILLAPTSLPPGTKQMIVEHRMYLPLAAIILLVEAAARRFQGEKSGGPPLLLGALAIPLAFATVGRNRDYRSELALWQDTVAKRPANSVARCNYGVALFAVARPQEAIAQYRTALTLDPANAEAQYDLANALAQTGNLSDALATFEAALRVAPADAKARCNYANTLILARRPAEAFEQFKIALRLDPLSSRAHNDLGFALAGQGRWPEALAEYDRAAELRPGDPQIAYNRAGARAQTGQLDGAASEYRRAFRLQPTYPEAHNNLANLLARSGQPQVALPEFAEAIRERPTYWQARFNCAMALFAIGKVDEAREQLQEVLKENPGFSTRDRFPEVVSEAIQPHPVGW